MKKLAKLSPGRIFNFAGEKFVVMEQRDGAAFVLLAQSKESCPFNDKDDAENRNDYTRSTLKERIDKWVEALPRTSEEAAAILPFEVDLSCTDRSKSYGTITVKAADKVIILVEGTQSGLFAIHGIPVEALQHVTNVVCPAMVYPYLRANLADLMNRANVPPVHLPEVNFEVLYQQRLAQAQAEAEGAAQA